MKYYHGTTTENAFKILKQGFKKSYGRFGNGVYLTSNLEYASSFSTNNGKIIECDFSGKVAIIDYYLLNDIFPNANINIEEEEGYTELSFHINDMGYDGVLIVYDQENDNELVVYNTKCIQFIKIKN